MTAACGSSLARKGGVLLLFLLEVEEGFSVRKKNQKKPWMLPLLPLLPPGCPVGQGSLTTGIPPHEVLGPHVILGRGTKVYFQMSSRHLAQCFHPRMISAALLCIQ